MKKKLLSLLILVRILMHLHICWKRENDWIKCRWTSFYGSAQLIDVRDFKHGQIDLKYLQKNKEIFMINDFVIFNTGYEQDWGQESYFKEYPVLSTAAAQWLSAQNIKGIGLDACSVDPVGSDDLPVHHILFAADLLIVENLTNLHQLPDSQFIFSCFPLKIVDADGSPVRAVAILN